MVTTIVLSAAARPLPAGQRQPRADGVHGGLPAVQHARGGGAPRWRRHGGAAAATTRRSVWPMADSRRDMCDQWPTAVVICATNQRRLVPPIHDQCTLYTTNWSWSAVV